MEFVTTLAPNCLCDGWERKKKVWPTILALARCNIYFVRSPLLIIIKHVGNKLNVHVVVIWFLSRFPIVSPSHFQGKNLLVFLLATKFRSLHTISISNIDAPWLVHGQTGWTASFLQ